MTLEQLNGQDFLHYSQISTRLSCGKKHDFAYELQLEPRVSFERMQRGNLGHAVLEDLWRSSPWTKTDAVIADLHTKQQNGALDENLNVDEMATEMRAVAIRVFDHITMRFRLYKDHIEKSLLWDVNGTLVGGTPDVVVEDKNDGSVWILDYKFRQSFFDPESELLNLQMIFYTKLFLENEGVLPAGTRQVQALPFLPKQPKLTKAGAMSRSDLRSDWETYSNACRQAGLDPNEYLEMKEKLASKVFIDMDSCWAARSAEEIDFHVNETLLPTIADIVAERKGVRTYNNLLCNGCGFRELCVAEAKGMDVDWIISNSYKRKGEEEQMFVLEEDV